MLKIAISSASIDEQNLTDLCEFASRQQIESIELSGNLCFQPGLDVKSCLSEYRKKIKFYIHNYFPAPKDPFVLNLGHPYSVEVSYLHCIETIDLCSQLEIPFYSIHAGMAFNPLPESLGKKQGQYSAIPFKRSRDLLLTSLLKLADYSQKKGVEILIENNSIAASNNQGGVNNRYHFSDPDESQLLFPVFEHPNIGVLLDVGHLKVTSRTLEFDPVLFINQIKTRIRAIHFSENNGYEDENLPFEEDSWFWHHIPWKQIGYGSIELKPQPVSLLKGQVDLIFKFNFHF